MCGPFTSMVSSIGTIVTLSKNVLLIVFRYTSSYDPVRTFFIKMWIIPKVVPQIRKEFLPLLKCKTWRQKLCNDKISIICKPRVEMRLYLYNSKLFSWKTVVDWNRIVRDIFHPRKIIRHRIVFSFSIYNLQIKFLKKEYPSYEPWFGILFLHKILNGSMVSMNNNLRINNILPKLITSKHHYQEFLLGSSIILLSTINGFASIVYNIQLLINPLS